MSQVCQGPKVPRHFFALRHASIRFVGQGQVMLGATYVEPSSLGIVAALTCHRSFKRVHRFQVSFLGCCAGERDVAYHFSILFPLQNGHSRNLSQARCAVHAILDMPHLYP